MTYAKKLMDEGLLGTKEIAQLCGYSNPYYFVSVYKKYFGKDS